MYKLFTFIFLYPLEEAGDVSSTKKQKSKFKIRLKLLSHFILKMVHINWDIKFSYVSIRRKRFLAQTWRITFKYIICISNRSSSLFVSVGHVFGGITKWLKWHFSQAILHSSDPQHFQWICAWKCCSLLYETTAEVICWTFSYQKEKNVDVGLCDSIA